MEKEHRDAIQNCFSSLVEQTDLDVMVSTLFEKGVFSDLMIEAYKDTTKDMRNRKRQLYRDITRRGPHAFNHLLDALMENGYWDIVRELDPSSPLYRPTRTGPSNEYVRLADKKTKNTGKEQDDPNLPRRSPQPKESPPGGNQEPPRPSIEPPPQPPTDPEGSTSDLNKIPTFNVIKSTKFFDDNGRDIKLYHTRGRNRGVLLLFSYVEFQFDIDTKRNGALVDADNLKYLFDELGLKTLSYLNLSLKETKKALEELKNGICKEGPETVFVVFSSHGYAKSGSGDTDIRCSDGRLISYSEIIDYFNNLNFPSLRGIPKVFIFQTCRGSNNDLPHAPPRLRQPRRRGVAGGAGDGDGARSSTEADGTVDDSKDQRIYSDIIIANSTVPGYASNRDALLGSWYIQALCAVFAARAHDCHVADLFTLVDKQLEERFRTQTSSVDSWGVNRHLYLHPGLYED